MKEEGVLLSPTTAFNPIGAMMLPSAGLSVRSPLPPSPVTLQRCGGASGWKRHCVSFRIILSLAAFARELRLIS